MANECYNYIRIQGDVNEIKEFKEYLASEDIYLNLCNYFIKDIDVRYFDIEIEETTGENEIIISGISAWIPCLVLFTNISSKYKSFEIYYEYEEPGCDFSGFANISKGNCNDNRFKYWEGKVKTNKTDAFYQAIECVENENEYYESEDELINSSIYQSFEEEEQKEILKTWKELR